MKKYDWTCPECGNKNIVMRTVNAILITPIDGIEMGEPCFNKNEGHILDSDTPYYYECSQCDYVLVEGTDEDFMEAIKPYLVKSLEKSDDADKEEEQWERQV